MKIKLKILKENKEWEDDYRGDSHNLQQQAGIAYTSDRPEDAEWSQIEIYLRQTMSRFWDRVEGSFIKHRDQIAELESRLDNIENPGNDHVASTEAGAEQLPKSD